MNHKQEKPMAGANQPNDIAIGEKANDFLGSIKRLSQYCQRYIPLMVISMILAIIASVFSLIGPGRLSEITDIITDGLSSNIDIKMIVRIGIFLASIYGLSWIFSYVQGFIMATVSARISQRLRTDIVKKINRLPLSYFDQRSYGDTLSLVTNDIDTIGTSLNQSLSSLISGIFMFAGSLLMMFVTNWIMAVSGLVATLIGFILMSIIISRSQNYFVSQQEQLGGLNGHIEEVYAGHTVIKAYNAEKEKREQFKKRNDSLYECAWKSQFLSGLMMPIMSFIGNFAYVVVCVVGAVLTIRGDISFGVIVAFMVYIRLFTQPLSTLAQAATTLQSTAAASERVFDFLDEKELVEDEGKSDILTSIKGSVEFCHVHFGYSENKIIINDFNARIQAGQKVAIVGPTGAGKTTLVNLLMRFYELSSGQILLDGISIADITRENLHELFGMVLQDTWIFEGSLLENIAYNRKDISEETIINACKAVGLHHYIMTLPDGYHTVLNDQTSLSAGQRQLITIARTMVENAPLMILDEATSSVDTRTELLIQEAMDKLSKGRTSFIIAHRLSTIKNADLIGSSGIVVGEKSL